MDFVALDFETANHSRGSICQVGIVGFASGQVVAEYSQLVNPEEPFHPFNVRIHGIHPSAVQAAPTLPRIYDDLLAWLDGRIVVTHTAFDIQALEGACCKYRLPRPRCDWLDSAAVARGAWPGRFSDHKLKTIARELGIRFRHHCACEDARAAGQIVVRACACHGRSPSDWNRLTR